MRRCRHGRFSWALALCAGLAMSTVGCGKSSPDGAMAEVDPNLGKKHKETKEWFDNHKSVPGVNSTKVRDHP